MEANLQSYYVYSNAVFRVNPLTKQLYLRERQSGGWKEIKDPVIWEGIDAGRGQSFRRRG